MRRHSGAIASPFPPRIVNCDGKDPFRQELTDHAAAVVLQQGGLPDDLGHAAHPRAPAVSRRALPKPP